MARGGRAMHRQQAFAPAPPLIVALQASRLQWNCIGSSESTVRGYHALYRYPARGVFIRAHGALGRAPALVDRLLGRRGDSAPGSASRSSAGTMPIEG